MWQFPQASRNHTPAVHVLSGFVCVVRNGSRVAFVTAIVRRGTTDAGFTLLEVLLAASLLIVVAVGVSGVIAAAIRASASSRARSFTTILAAEKMEQLRSLAWTSVVVGTPPLDGSPEDVSTDLSVDPPDDSGSGLLPSPPDTLESNVPLYVDYLDSDGAWVGNGTRPPSNATYIRRWAVQRLASDPDNVLVFHVMVMARATASETIHLASMKARR